MFAYLAAAGTSSHESGAHHVLREEVWVGVPADRVVDDRLPQTLEPVGVAAWEVRGITLVQLLSEKLISENLLDKQHISQCYIL